MALLVGAALIVNFGGAVADLAIPVVNLDEIGAEGGFARSLPGPLVGVGLRTEMLDAEVMITAVWESDVGDFVGNLPAL